MSNENKIELKMFRVRVFYDTVICAETESEAKEYVQYGTGEIDDKPTSVYAVQIRSMQELPKGWTYDSCPWGALRVRGEPIGPFLTVQDGGKNDKKTY